ncbi:MAG TPA: hotdog domain-containing protein [Candidatus Methylomirabilis sp.]|nr:hotdog domain-containing protein [Candidatus Methylomirabilis sp.]
MSGLQIGLRGTATMRVTPETTAQAWGSGDVPVFATPSLVALLETAAVNAVAGGLAAGETTVGTWIEVSHLAASPVGAVVTAEAELTAVDGRTLTFAVVARDHRQTVGEGRHRRAIVSRQRFLEKAAGKP